jgi:hypothetical protein
VATNRRLSVTGSPVDNIGVCAKFFVFATGKSTNFLYQPNHRSNQMIGDLETNYIRPTPKEDAICLFMKDLSQYYQLSPDKDFVFLPFPKRTVVHDIYMDSALDHQKCHRGFFLKVWRTNRLITHIKLRKHLLFALCDTCVDFRDLQLVHHTHAERLILKKAQLEHHLFVKAERQLYYYRRDKGANPLDDSLSMIVDAADQSLYALPYHHIATHTSQKSLRIPVHLMGVLIHGRAVHAYTYFENFKQGNNVTIEAIHASLADQLAKNGSLPSTLYVQLDNTSKQCKGRYMIGWLGYLILTGVFTSIVLSFLPVGHTHEDIDQIFSRLSVYLACHNAFNLEQLHEAIRGSYQTKEGHRAQCEFWDRCTNFSDWIAPYLNNYDGISGFRQFRFFEKDGEVIVQARAHTSLKEEWAGIRGQDALTKVFKSLPPTEMVDVPPTQRRPLLTDELVTKQKASILALAERRRISPDLLTGVLAGVDSLGEDADLPFTWDLSRLLNYNADAVNDMVDDDEKVDGNEMFAYKHELDTIVLIRPTGLNDEPFWLGKLVNLGAAPDHIGQYEVWWMCSTTLFGTWTMCFNNRKPLVDWQPESSIQDTVRMVKKGKKINKKSVRLIKNYMKRWQQEVDEVDGDLEPESIPAENFMDVD